jgi:hypothetical protein
MTEARSHELEQRRDELARSLPGLSREQDASYRRNSDAVALGRAGVKHEQPEEIVRLGEAAVAADGAVRDAQVELREIHAEMERMPRRSLGARFGRRVRRAGVDR